MSYMYVPRGMEWMVVFTFIYVALQLGVTVSEQAAAYFLVWS